MKNGKSHKNRIRDIAWVKAPQEVPKSGPDWRLQEAFSLGLFVLFRIKVQNHYNRR
jgi:hypothetical protein